MAEAAEPPAKQPASVYSDRRSLLFGLHGLTFARASRRLRKANRVKSSQAHHSRAG